MKLNQTTVLVLSALLASSAAMAQTKAPEPDFTLSYNVGVVSDYRFRAISQTSFKPALQAGVDFAHKSGFYLGAWGSNVAWIKDYVGAADGSLEVDLYGGYKGELVKDLTFDIGLIAYQYPGNTAAKVAGFVNANTTEIYGALSYGVVTAKYSYSTSNFIANSNSSGSAYVEVAATLDLGNGFTLTPHIGHQTIPNQAINGDYTDYSLTLAKDFGNGFTATITALGTNAGDAFYKVAGYDNLGKSALAVGVKYSF
ncbi:MAG: hypothetical protein D4R79_10595 [Comamonadaceae bacterium]|nr:TorF family putative porin [Rhodoferax sp.]TSA10928.1 MAG: hypothetical protein D4R79_10595 [Comamonadaceae bacterium]